MNNYYFSQTKRPKGKTLTEAVELYWKHLYKVGNDENVDKTFRTYHLLYYEIIQEYLSSDKNLQVLIENVVAQIDVRFPWVEGGARDALGIIGAELSNILAQYSTYPPFSEDKDG